MERTYKRRGEVVESNTKVNQALHRFRTGHICASIVFQMGNTDYV